MGVVLDVSRRDCEPLAENRAQGIRKGPESLDSEQRQVTTIQICQPTYLTEVLSLFLKFHSLAKLIYYVKTSLFLPNKLLQKMFE